MSRKKRRSDKLAKDAYMQNPQGSNGPSTPAPPPPPPPTITKSQHPTHWMARELKAGKTIHHENGTKASSRSKLNEKTKKMEVTHYKVTSPHGMQTYHDTPEQAAHAAYKHTVDPKFNKGGEVAQTPRPDRTQNRLKITAHVNAKTSNEAVDRIFHGKKQPVQKLGMNEMRLNAKQRAGKSLANVQNQLNNASSVGAKPAKISKPAKTSPTLSHVQRQLDNASSVVGKSKRRAAKSFEVMSIDQYYDAVTKAEGTPPATPGAAPGTPKKFPRQPKPTVKMKPISDAEAMANLKAGKHYEKALRRAKKALQTGYGKTSGGGALKAANRKPSKHDLTFSLTIPDLSRAVGAQPPPVPGSSQRPYLPGVHSPSAKPKFKDAGRFMGMPAKKMKKTIHADKASKTIAGGGALELALRDPEIKKSRYVVQKSEGAATMAKMDFNDLFKSEIGNQTEDVLCECPHCDAPITKSDLSKASGHKGKGATTHLTGAEHGPSSAHVVKQNPAGGVMRGGEGKGVHTSSRGVPGAKKTDAVIGVQNGKGSKHTAKSANQESKEDDDSSSDDKSSKAPPFGKKKDVKKSINNPLTIVRGTEWVQYVDNGEDARIAKSIAEGSVGQQPTQPMDLNNDLSRLLI